MAEQIEALQKEINDLNEQITVDNKRYQEATDDYNQWNDKYTDISNEIDALALKCVLLQALSPNVIRN